MSTYLLSDERSIFVRKISGRQQTLLVDFVVQLKPEQGRLHETRTRTAGPTVRPTGRRRPPCAGHGVLKRFGLADSGRVAERGRTSIGCCSRPQSLAWRSLPFSRAAQAVSRRWWHLPQRSSSRYSVDYDGNAGNCPKMVWQRPRFIPTNLLSAAKILRFPCRKLYGERCTEFASIAPIFCVDAFCVATASGLEQQTKKHSFPGRILHRRRIHRTNSRTTPCNSGGIPTDGGY